MNDPHSRIIFLGPVFFIKRKCSVFTAVAFRQSRVRRRFSAEFRVM